MTIHKKLFLDKGLRCGGFYELAIQVCPSTNNEPIRLYTDFIWTLENVSGPFDEKFNPVTIRTENAQLHGLIRLDNFDIPFLTMNIRESTPVETGYNWFDICFYTSTIEYVFGSEYNTWTEKPKVPGQLTDYFVKTAKALYKIFPFELAMLAFEVSGEYYLDDLTKPLTLKGTWLECLVGKKHYNTIAPENRFFVKWVEEL
jgi:hypothetical protein